MKQHNNYACTTLIIVQQQTTHQLQWTNTEQLILHKLETNYIEQTTHQLQWTSICPAFVNSHKIDPSSSIVVEDLDFNLYGQLPYFNLHYDKWPNCKT